MQGNRRAKFLSLWASHYWRSNSLDASSTRTAIMSQAPLSKEKMVCPNCEKDEVGTYTANDSFLYGVENPVRLVAKDVLFFRCMACELEFTGEDGEQKREEAVRAHLAT